MIIDKSGSMSGLVDDTVGGFNEYLLDRQRETPDALMSVTLFDTTLDRLHVAQPVDTIPALTAERYRHGGMRNTALNDAVGETITEIDASPAAKERRKLVVVMTDGQENASREWTTRAAVAQLVALKEAEGWKFVFFGANIDAFKEGESLNVPAARSISYRSTPAGTRGMYKKMSRASSMYSSNATEDSWVAELAKDEADDRDGA